MRAAKLSPSIVTYDISEVTTPVLVDGGYLDGSLISVLSRKGTRGILIYLDDICPLYSQIK